MKRLSYEHQRRVNVKLHNIKLINPTNRKGNLTPELEWRPS